MFGGFLNSLFKAWDERSGTSLYAIFLMWLAIVNWRFLFILFWEDGANISGLRSEYAVQTHFFETGKWYTDVFVNFSFYVLPAAIMTALVIWYFPKLVKLAHKKTLEYEFERKRMRLDEQVKYDQHKAKKDTARADAAVEQKEAEQKVQQSLSEEQKWEIEANELRNSPEDTMAVSLARETIYRTRGNYSTVSQSTSSMTHISPDYLARIDTLGIAEIDSARMEMNATPKGKFFFRFLEKNGLIPGRG